ncbi:MAG TPA: hypothetical protein VEJ39_06695 [Candidatus Acidoferrales bacterium]|nr:hypothetical protein [Candidatus Acidoferrales bacterium]
MSSANPAAMFPAENARPSDLAKTTDRRRANRGSVMIPVRLRPARFDDGIFEDITSTANVSRGCLSITTWRDSYFVGMRLLLTYPFISSNRSPGWEYIGEVVRVNELPDGRYQVVAKLQFVMQSSPSPRLISLTDALRTGWRLDPR